MAMSLYVGGLPYATTEATVRALFAQVGDVRAVRLIKDRESGLSKGFAFVEMANKADAERAIERFNGYQLDGRFLVVNEARSREERGGSPRSTGGYAVARGGYRGK